MKEYMEEYMKEYMKEFKKKKGKLSFFSYSINYV